MFPSSGENCGGIGYDAALQHWISLMKKSTVMFSLCAVDG